MSPTQLSLRYLRKSGYVCGIAEHWFQPPGMTHGRRRDLFGFIDLVALGHGSLIAVQTTTKANARARLLKIRGVDCYSAAFELLQVPGCVIHIHGWASDPIRPARVIDVTLAELAGDPSTDPLPF